MIPRMYQGMAAAEFRPDLIVISLERSVEQQVLSQQLLLSSLVSTVHISHFPTYYTHPFYVQNAESKKAALFVPLSVIDGL